MQLWTPALINPDLWLDASDANTITLVDGKVSQWADKLGKAIYATQLSAAARPAVAAASLNGLDALLFDGVDDFLTLGTALGKPGSYTVYAVSRITKALSNTQNVIGSTDSTGQSARSWGTFSNLSSQQGKLCWQYGDGSLYRYGFASGAFTANTWAQHCLRHEGGVQDETVYRDGSVLTNSGQSGTATVSSGTAYSMSIGRGGDIAGNYLGGNVAEVIICRSALSFENLQNVDGYKAWRWGLVGNLPANHLYKSSPPYVMNLSGNVMVSGVPRQRTVAIYREPDLSPLVSLQSNPSTGDWATTVVGRVNDKFRVFIVGQDGEYSRVFENVAAG